MKTRALLFRRFAGSLALAACALLIASCASIQTGIQPGGTPPPAPAVKQLEKPPAGIADALVAAIDSLLNDSLIQPSLLGVKLVSLDDGKILYERNANLPFHPASNMKILTTGAAITLLPPAFVFRTQVYANAPIEEHTLPGSLYVRGSGDPLLKTEGFDSIAGRLTAYGIRRIGGNLIGDVSCFDTLAWGPGWMWDDEPDPDEAFISPLTVNDNAVHVFLSAGRKIGSRGEIAFDPPSSFLPVVNHCITVRDTFPDAASITRKRGTDTIVASGAIGLRRHLPEVALSVHRPERYFLQLLRERLEANGISVDGRVAFDTTRGKILLAEITHPLDSVLHRINKVSDNLAAENLLKALSKEKSGAPGSTAGGMSIARRYLAGIGIDTTGLLLADGSGVSWYNAVSPNTIVSVLQDQYRNKAVFQRFYETLPVAGRDGTLKNRMRGTRAEGNVRGKTGSLTGNSAISGYVTAADGRMLAYSILCNHFPKEISILRSAQDRILELLAGWTFTPAQKKSVPHGDEERTRHHE